MTDEENIDNMPTQINFDKSEYFRQKVLFTQPPFLVDKYEKCVDVLRFVTRLA